MASLSLIARIFSRISWACPPVLAGFLCFLPLDDRLNAFQAEDEATIATVAETSSATDSTPSSDNAASQKIVPLTATGDKSDGKNASPHPDKEEGKKNNDPAGKPDDKTKSGDKKPDDGKTDDANKPIQRPSKSPNTPDPKEFDIKPDADGKFKLNFNGQPWQPVLEWLADRSSKSLDWQELPGDYLNLSTKQSHSIQETRGLINRHLLIRGFTLLCQEDILTVVNLKKLDVSLVPRITPEQLKECDSYDFVKVAIPLYSLSAEDAADEMKTMLSPFGKMIALKATNRIDVIDTACNIKGIYDLLEEKRLPRGQENEVHEFKLNYARAEKVEEQLRLLLGLEKAGGPQRGGPQNDPNQQQQQQQQNNPQQQQNQKAAKQPMPVYLVADVRRNTVIAHASSDKMAIIAQAVKMIDIPGDNEASLLQDAGRMQVYRLNGIDPEPVIKTLEEIGNLDPSTHFEIDKKSKAIIAYAPLADHIMIRTVVKKLSGSERRFEVIRLRRLAAESVAGTIDFMFNGEKKKTNSRYSYFIYDSAQKSEKGSEFRVDPDVEHNRLLLWANETELVEVRNLLEKLGELPDRDNKLADIRVYEVGDPEKLDELLDRIRRTWPSLAPNALLIEKAESLDKKNAPAPRPSPADQEEKTDSPVEKENNSPKTTFKTTAYFSPKKTVTPEDKSTLRQPQSAPKTDASPIRVRIDADGRITATCDDPAALDLFEEIVGQYEPPRRDYKIFYLKYAYAYGVAKTLEVFFKDGDKQKKSIYDYIYGDMGDSSSADDKSGRLSKKATLKFISDADTNSILVQGGDAKQLKLIKELIDLYDKPAPTDAQSVRKTEIIHVDYAKAPAVAETVKEVYRDLLSDKDKAFQGKGDQSRGMIYSLGLDDDGNSEQKTPKFKGLLSVGVDENSNSLILSAPAYLFDQVKTLIAKLDEEAAQMSVIEVVKLKPEVRGPQLEKSLVEALGGKVNVKDSSSEKSGKTNPKKDTKKGGPENRYGERRRGY